MNANVTATETTELVVIPAESALQVFTEPGAIGPYLDMVRKRIDSFVPNMATAAGRKEIKSFAYQITRSKTALDAAGKKVVDDLKALPKKVDETRRHVRETLDAWAEEVRKPVDDFDAAEEARIKRHGDALDLMSRAAQLPHGIAAMEIQARINTVEAVEVSAEACDEFLEDYTRAKASALDSLRPAHAAAVKHEADQAELAELRRQAEERAERDRQEAEAKATREREERLQREAAEKATRDAEAQAQADREAAQRQLEEAERARQAAEQRAAQAEENARLEAAATEARLREEADQLERQARAEQAAREANRDHRATVNREAVAALMKECALDETYARVVVTAIAKKQIPHIQISY